MMLVLASTGVMAEELTDEQAVEILVDQGYVTTVSEGTPLSEDAFSELARYPSGQTADGQVILTSVNPEAVQAVKEAGGQIPSAEETGGVLSLSMGNEVAVTVVAEGAAVEFASAISPILKIDGTNTYLYATDVNRVQPSTGGADYTATAQTIDGSDEELVKMATVLYWGFGGQGYLANRELLGRADSDREIEQMYIGTWVALRWAIGEIQADNPKVTGNACASWLVNDVWADAGRHVTRGSMMRYQPLNSSVTPLAGQVVRSGSSSVVPGPGVSGKTGNLRIILSDASDTTHKLSGGVFTILGTGGYTQTVTTNADGWADFPAIPVDTYIIMQDAAPSGYAAISEPVSFTLEELGSQTTFQTLDLQNSVNRGKLRIISHITTDQSMTLPGGSFKVTDMATGHVYGPYSAGADGFVEITDITVGEYKVERLACPDGYEPNPSDPGPWTIGVSSQDISNVQTNGWTVLYVPNDPTDSSFRIHLQSSDTKEPIEGAVFSLETVPEGRQVGYGRTNAAGEIVFSGLDNDVIYSLHQVSTPIEYEIPREVEYQRIKTDILGRQVPITVENNYIGNMGSVNITVTDATTGGPVQDVELRVFNHATGQYLPKSLLTKNDGQAIFENLQSGRYTVVLTSVPGGYETFTPLRTETEVVQNQVAQVAFQVRPVVKKGIVEVTVVDENNLPVRGARFSLKRQHTANSVNDIREEAASSEEGKVYFHNVDDGTYLLENYQAPQGYRKATERNPRLLEAKTNTVTKETFILENDNPDYGKLEVTQYAGKSQSPLEGARFQAFSVKEQKIVATETTSATGLATFILPEGEYIIRQAYLPANYRPDTKDRYVQIRKGRTTQEVYVAPDLKEYGGIEIINYEADSIRPAGGSQFEIWSADGRTRISGPKTTNADGKVSFASIEEGSYLVRQTKPADGFERSAEEKSVTVVKNKTAQVIWHSIRTPEVKGSLSLHAVDAETGEPLSGAAFALYKGATQVYGPYYSGLDGYISASGLDLGSYNLVEIQAPNGYDKLGIREGVVMNDKSPRISRTMTYRKSELPTGQVRVENFDNLTNAALPGATFVVRNASGNEYARAVADKNGIAVFNNLPAGSYTVRQQTPPEGYKLNTEVKPAGVQAGGLVSVSFGNDPDITSGDIDVHVWDTTQTATPLGNVQVGLYSSMGFLIRSEYTDIYGAVYFHNVPFGVYTVRQMTRLDGFAEPDSERVYLRSDKTYFDLDIRNVRLPDRSKPDIPEEPEPEPEKAGNLEVVNTMTGTGRIDSFSYHVEYTPACKAESDFTLGPNEVKTITGIPAGTTYKVSRTEQTDGPEYSATGLNVAGVIREGATARTEYTSEVRDSWKFKVHSGLLIENHIDGSAAGNADRNFTYLISGDTHADAALTSFSETVVLRGESVWFSNCTATEGYTATVRQTEIWPGTSVSPESADLAFHAGGTEKASFVISAAKAARLQVMPEADGTDEVVTGTDIAIANEAGETVVEDTVTADNGYQTVPLPLGRYTVKVTDVPEGYALSGEAAEAELAEDNKDEDVVLKISREEDEAQSACITVHIANNAGEPLRDVEFAILNASGQTVTSGRSDAEGIYRSMALSPGTYTVRQVSALSGYQSGGDRTIELLSGTDMSVEFTNLRREQVGIEASIDSFSNRSHTAGTGDTVTLIATVFGSDSVKDSRQVQVAMTVDPRLQIIQNRTVRMIVRNDTENELLVGDDYIATVNPGTGQVSVDMTAAGIRKFADLGGQRIDIMVDTVLGPAMAVQGNMGEPVYHSATLTHVDSYGAMTQTESNRAEVHAGGASLHLQTEDTGIGLNEVGFKIYRSREDAIQGVNALLNADGSEYTPATNAAGDVFIAPLAYGESTHPYDAGGISVYWLVQQDAVPGYQKTAEPIRMEITRTSAAQPAVLVTNSRIRLSVGFSVLGSDTRREIKAAALRLVTGTDPNGTDVVSEWLTSESDIVRYPLLPGDYTLVQTAAPFGYTSAPAIIFRVTENSVDQLVDGVYVPVSNGLIQMTDRKTEAPENGENGSQTTGKVTVTFGSDKTGQDTDQTSVQLYDGQTGGKIHEWTSKVPYSVDLEPGIYSFTETAQDGSATETTFRVNEDGTVDVKDGDRWIPSESAINTTTTWKTTPSDEVQTQTETVQTDSSQTGQQTATQTTVTTESVGTQSGSTGTAVVGSAVSTTQTTGESNVSTGVMSMAAVASIALLVATAGLIISRKLKNQG